MTVFFLIQTDDFRSEYDITWDFTVQSGVKHSVIRLPGYDAMGRLFAIGYLKGILDAVDRS